MDTVRVLHVHTRLIQGGGDENTLFTVNGLDPNRYAVDLAVGSESEHRMLAQIHPRVRTIMVPELVRRIAPSLDLLALHRLRRLISLRRYHIVHTHLAKGGIIGRFAAHQAGGCAIIHTFHGQTFHPHLPSWKFHLYRGLERAAGAFTDTFIAVGEELRDWYQRAGVGFPDQYHVVHSGMSLHMFRQAAASREVIAPRIRASLGIPNNVPIVGKIARHTEGKGHEYFLDLAERLLQHVPHARFVALGGGERMEQFRDAVRARGLEGRVITAGFRTDIAEVLACLDVVVLTSLWEGLPRVLVQAAAARVPVVTFEVGGAREVVRDGVNGYIVPSKDVATMEKRVRQLLEAPQQAQRMGLAGQRFADDRWSIEQMVTRIEAIYEDTLARRRPTGEESC